jgi:hypothetical protein
MKRYTEPTISGLLKSLSYSIHCELATSFVEHVLFLPSYDNTFATEINDFFKSIYLYQLGKIDLDTVYDQRWQLNNLISYNKKNTQYHPKRIDTDAVKNLNLELGELIVINEDGNECSHMYSVSPIFSKYLQKKIKLVLSLYIQCCSKELISRNPENSLAKALLGPGRSIYNIAFDSRFLRGLSLYGQDWDSDDLLLQKSVRKKSGLLALEEYNWQLEQIKNKLKTIPTLTENEF